MVRHLPLVCALVVISAAAFALPAYPQDLAYHSMADERSLAGIPNGLNVLSNLPFAVVGLMGLFALSRARPIRDDRREAWAFVTLFTGVSLTAIGSSYYHLAPDNARLVWDRIPMSIGFAGLIAVVVSERIGIRTGLIVLGPAILLGIGSVYYWYWTERQGAGDLRLYGLVQFGSLITVLLLILLYPHRHGSTWYLVAGLATYGAAKIFELYDQEIFALGQIVSGHTLKHLAAAAGVGFVTVMVRSWRVRQAPQVQSATS